MKKILMSLVASGSLLFAAASFTACGEADEAIDCAKICNKYAECVEEDYDETACIERCETKADEDENFAEATDDCESCIDERSCGESWVCIDECIAIVP
jgi:hypothetical protein